MGDIAHFESVRDAERVKRGELPSIRRDLADSFLQGLIGLLDLAAPNAATPPDEESDEHST